MHPFKRLTIDAHFNYLINRRVLVEWALERAFITSVPGPYTFTLYRGYAANDSIPVKISETTDQPWLYDNNPVMPQKGTEVFYWVILTDGQGQTYQSQSAPITSYWNHYDWTLAKEIVRKETMLLRKRTGTAGWLLKRRLWGDVCTLCTDPETKQIHNSQCPVCYGTGIVGGYYDPIDFMVAMNPSQRVKKLDTTQGLIAETMETVRCLAYPVPTSNDVWVRAYTDQRYYVMGDVVVEARHRGIDLVLNLRLREEARSNSIYKFPIPCSLNPQP